MCKENIVKFKDSIANLNFSDIYNTHDPNKAYDSFLNIFMLLYNLCFPKLLIKINTKRKQKWISRGIKVCSIKQRKLLWQCRLNPNHINKITLKSYSYRLKKIIKLTKKAQNCHTIKTSENKCRATWQIINDSKNNFPKEPIHSILNNDKLITDPQEIADAFNDFFIDQTSIDSNIKNDPGPGLINIESSINSMFMTPAQAIDILKIIKNMKNTNSVGYDDISTKVLKSVAEIIAPVLAYIVNLCIDSGIFPTKLKPTVVKPLFKKEDRQQLKYYRPIALISVISKIFEKYFYNIIYSFLDKNKILAREQYGFRKNKTINMAIFEIINTVMQSVDDRIPICALYMDMSKAFDCVDHKTLLAKLNLYGIRGNALQLLKSYLEERTQYTEITKICHISKKETVYLSKARKVNYGVPQGSVLGPLLFLIYINDMPKYIKFPTILFADDSTAIIKCNNDENYENNINNTLLQIIKWLKLNNLKANLEKTKLMQFYQRTSSFPNLQIKHDNINIEEVLETKFLGLHIDNKLTWKRQSQELSKKLSKFAYTLYKLSKVVNTETLLTAYHGYVSSALRYGIIFWGNCTERETIFKGQKRCIRAMFNLKRTESCKPLYMKHKILTLPSLYIYEVAIFVKTNPNLFTRAHEIHSRNLRNRDRLCAHKGNTALLRKSILCMAPQIYNKLPRALIECDIKKFKNELFKLLVKGCYYNINDFLADNFK
ncbi:hypothetical protein JYU34_009224 [Plutella xylostella]|uniref:Reverse transcriptase domain-containing protein n=1 Tax=Plutella xylostella TaxID=51655 RepID=A0ABQ7QJ29_PLUXY|nr:hypothetical protein JYU34_009224 [Plutella xylostella]